jgi:DNA-binding NarL/FixJ family response regulator
METNRRMNHPRNRTILVVDDEPGIRMILQRFLEKWKFNVLTAENGHRAMELIQTDFPDVVITDLFMPQMDGFELLKHLRATAPELPVIIISGQGERGDVIEALRLGAWDYLYKPIENASFLHLAIKRVLEKVQLLSENRAYHNELENLVARKSAELLDQQKVLIDKTISLEKANDALKRLLDQREIEKNAIEQTMVRNLKRFVFPYLDELEKSPLGKRSQIYLDIIRTNIEQLILPVSQSLGGAYRCLTPLEVKVADFIREGQSTKSIAAVLNISPSTVEKHRNKIRKKLGILNQKINLQTYLNSLA